MKLPLKPSIVFLSALAMCGCSRGSGDSETKAAADSAAASFGSIERLDPSLNAIIAEDARIEIIAEGHTWTEGPLWVPAHNMLLYSDIPPNKVFKWTESGGVEEYLHPSGYTGTEPSGRAEPGSNGLLLDKDGRLVLCHHGDRCIAAMDAPLDDPSPKFIPLVSSYQGKKLNSPNDAVFDRAGNLWFTDPPYGLPQNVDDPTKELPYQGVFRVTPNGEVRLLTDSITRPNGIALTPDEKKLVVANSDPEKAVWYIYDITAEGKLTNGGILYDATEDAKTAPGLPDGFKFDSQGNLFASGPGGIWIFNPEGKLIGKIRVNDPASNCALTPDDKVLFITNDDRVLRVRLRE
ncbi:MAG TPA: SMP-30/gluconolactonase/LRE family protein [Cyclobacteriaceae bacterium]